MAHLLRSGLGIRGHGRACSGYGRHVWFSRYVGALIAACIAAAAFVVPALAQNHAPDVLFIEDSAGNTLAKLTPQSVQEQFAMQLISTRTPWSSGKVLSYRGPFLKDILVKYKIHDATAITVSAYNDFRSNISMQEIDEYDPILAIQIGCTAQEYERKVCPEGETYRPLTLDDYGPFFVAWDITKIPANYVPSRNAIWVWFAVRMRPL